MPQVSEWVAFLSHFNVTESDMQLIIQAVQETDFPNIEPDPCLIFYDQWWTAHSNTFCQYVYQQGYNAWLSTNPNYQQACA